MEQLALFAPEIVRRYGRRIVVIYGQIAAIARSRGMALATRNVRDFDEMGLDLLDPWADA